MRTYIKTEPQEFQSHRQTDLGYTDSTSSLALPIKEVCHIRLAG